MDIVQAFIAHPQASHLVDPRVGALHYPAVPTQPLLRPDAGPCNAGRDTAPTQASAVLARGVRLVGMQLTGSMPGTAAGLLHLRHRIQQGEQLVGVVDVGPGQALSQRVSLGVDER